jgi:hypothetical protein
VLSYLLHVRVPFSPLFFLFVFRTPFHLDGHHATGIPCGRRSALRAVGAVPHYERGHQAHARRPVSTLLRTACMPSMPSGAVLPCIVGLIVGLIVPSGSLAPLKNRIYDDGGAGASSGAGVRGWVPRLSGRLQRLGRMRCERLIF